MPDTSELREIGKTGVRVPAIAFGTSGLGHMPDTYGYDVSEERAMSSERRWRSMVSPRWSWA